jgi:hypothetical protein
MVPDVWTLIIPGVPFASRASDSIRQSLDHDEIPGSYNGGTAFFSLLKRPTVL